MADPNFSDVALLLHCNGSDASTTFTDSGPSTRTVTAVSPAQLDTAQTKFGSASGLFDGVTACLTVPSATEFVFGTGDFTLEAWIRIDDLYATGDNQFIFAKYTSGFAQTPWALYVDVNTDDKLTAICYNTSNSLIVNIKHQTALVADTWYHVALTRSGSTFRIFLDGVVGSTTATSSAELKSSSDVVSVGGGRPASSTLGPFYGWIDDVRITKGVARYTATFTPPAAEFEEGAAAVDAYIAETAGPLSTDALLLVGQSGAFVEWASPLGAVLLLASNFHVFAAAESPLGASALVGFSDFTLGLAPEILQVQRYMLDLITPGGPVRVPMSSWQSTQQTTSQAYAGAVIPACAAWIDTLTEATEFAIYREALLLDGSTTEVEIVRSPLETLQIDQGPRNQTASISGYTDPVAAVEDPDAIYDRTLQGVRSISSYTSGARVRCAIDWMLRPAMRAYYADTSMVVAYINFYVTQNARSVEAYMDVGERIA